MGGRIVGLVSCLLCALPFFIISVFGRDSREPINFWAGDTALKAKVADVPEFNKRMAALYRKCAAAFLITGMGCLLMPLAGAVMLCFCCTLGIYFAYKSYKKILNRYS